MIDFAFYNTLNKPTYAPDKKLFRPVWIVLYLLMFISFAFLYFMPAGVIKTFAIILFCFQLVLNLSWTPVFFKYKKIGLAFAICASLLITVIFMTMIFFRISVLLGILQIPYIIWLLVATRLNYDIIRLN